jgi:hypothetical protein
MTTNADIHKMALGSYGYGNWKAPYWFVGPEQGMTVDEDINRRVEAWDGQELSDCRKFHEDIGEMRWHGEPPKLQKTWKQLMLFLMTFQGTPLNLDNPKDKGRLCAYQRDRWGRFNDETCVIELSGLPAHCHKAGERQRRDLFTKSEFKNMRGKRIEIIRTRMLASEPKLVVMYGTKESAHWTTIAEVENRFPPGVRPPIFVFPTHPVSFGGVSNAYWENLGTRLRHGIAN